MAINKTWYNNALRTRLLPFINEHHKNGDLFWQDLASSHCANDVIEFFESENINYVPKIKNPPNLQELDQSRTVGILKKA